MPDDELAAFVIASAATLDFQLNVQELEAMRDVVSGMQAQIALVSEYVPAEAAA